MYKKNQANFYLILNISPQAHTHEIKKAYLKLAQTYHPDKNRGNKLAEKKFQQINLAWQNLKDPKKRKRVDENLKISKKLSQTQSFLKEQEQKKRKEKAIDLEFPLKISLEDLCQSQSKTIHYFKPVNGTKIKSSFEVQIPLGARSGTRLRFKSQGGAEGKKVFGDLYVRVQIEAHKMFYLTEKSRDLLLERPISFVTAVQAQKMEIPSPYGFLVLNVTPPLVNKQLLKIKGHGLPKNSNGEKGDLFIKILIDYPPKDSIKIQKQMEKLSLQQKKIYAEKFKDSSFVYPKVLKFQKRMKELQKRYSK